MGTIKMISEYNRPENTIKTDDWDKAWHALVAEERIKSDLESNLDEGVYIGFSDVVNKIIDGRENVVFSPAATYLALIVMSELTGSETKKQILNALTIDEKNAEKIYQAVYMISEALCGYANSSISASIWLNEGLDYNQGLLEKIQENYHVSSYEGTMGSEEINSAITSWINKTTGNMLTKSISIKTTEDMLFDFFTTIYFCSKWEDSFWEEDTKPGDFILEDGKSVRCKYLYQPIKTLFHEGQKFTAMTKELKGGYDAIFVLPNEDIKVKELVGDSQLTELFTKCTLETTEKCDIKFSMPKFEVSSKVDLIDVMKKMGITDVFIPGVADFAPISNEEYIFLSKAEQTTRIKMDEEGVEAASCVEMGAVCAGIPPQYRKVRFELNRPFLFFIIAHGSIPLFAGNVMNPSER